MISQETLLERFTRGTTTGSASHMLIDGNVLYSYGHHFPLATRKKWGTGIEFLINGDRYSSTTSSQQSLCISNLTPNVQVPFSALDAAELTEYGLPQKGLKVVAHRPDSYYVTCRHCEREVEWLRLTGAEPTEYRHKDDATPLCKQAQGETTTRHVLGAVVLRHKGRYFLSSVDDGEPWRMRAYFLSQLPRKVASVEDAFGSLIPQEVREAQKAGLEVRRQGDIFVVATPLTTRQIPIKTHHHYPVFDTAHIATEARIDGSAYVRGTLRHQPSNRRPQHAMLRLGKAWWRAVKNTAVASWNAVGNVD